MLLDDQLIESLRAVTESLSFEGTYRTSWPLQFLNRKPSKRIKNSQKIYKRWKLISSHLKDKSRAEPQWSALQPAQHTTRLRVLTSKLPQARVDRKTKCA